MISVAVAHEIESTWPRTVTRYGPGSTAAITTWVASASWGSTGISCESPSSTCQSNDAMPDTEPWTLAAICRVAGASGPGCDTRARVSSQ